MSPQFDANDARTRSAWNGRRHGAPPGIAPIIEGRAVDVPEVDCFLTPEEEPRDYDLGEGD